MAELTEDELLKVLSSLDDPAQVLRPPGFDQRAAAETFDTLVARLDKAFGTTCEVDRDHEGSPMFGWVVVPSGATESGRFVWLSVSTFGPLAAATPGYPGFPTEESRVLDFSGADRRRVEGVLAPLGYLSVDEPLLWRSYDGEVPGCATWWDRFFGGPEN